MLFFVSFKASAEWDLSVDFLGRTLPEAGIVILNSGYGMLLWGEDPRLALETNPFYGYLRPNFWVAPAGTYNAAGVQLDFFPISILGGTVGASVVDNRNDYPATQCDRYRCQGTWTDQYAQAQMVVGFWKLFAIGQYRWDKWKYLDNDSQPFFEIDSGLAGAAGQDEVLTIRGFVGLEISKKWTVMAVGTYAEMQELRGFARFWGSAVVWTADQKDWRVTFGAGSFESDYRDRGPSAFLRISYEPYQDLAL